MNENSETVRRLIALMNGLDRAVIVARRERDAFPMGSEQYLAADRAAITRLYEFYSSITNSPEFAVLSRNHNA
jgi:hypothetical protein